MTTEISLRSEQRVYHASTQEELAEKQVELEPMGWEMHTAGVCPVGCKCGHEPFWGVFVMELPISAKEIN